MAAWLAYLKSRLLLPPEPTEEGPSAEELAARLAWRTGGKGALLGWAKARQLALALWLTLT